MIDIKNVTMASVSAALGLPTDPANDLVAKVARAVARSDGLGDHITNLGPWMRHAHVACDTIRDYYEAEICLLRERLGEALAADKPHRSDCAVHNAPAYEPGPCDCGAA